MEQQEYVSPSIDVEPEEEKSAFDRFAEVFTSPVRAFEGLNTAARKGRIILWGLIIAAIVIAFSVALFATNDEARQKIKDEQMAQFEKAHDEGKIKDEVYEQQKEVMDAVMSTPVFIAMGVTGGALGVALLALVVGLAVMIVTRVLSRDNADKVSFSAAFAATLIALMIANAGTIVTSIGMYLTSNPKFRISPSLLVDTDNAFATYFLNLIDPFTIWFLFALGTGVAVLARAERLKSIAAIASVWIIGGLLITGVGAVLTTTFGG